MPEPLLVSGLSGSPSAILVQDGRIAALGDDAATAPADRVIEGAGLTAHPGFIELQVNGVAQHDFTADPSSIGRAGRALARHGVTSFLPTIVTSPRGTVEAALEALEAADGGGAAPIGLHVEGPFISPQRHGAHEASQLRPIDLDEIAGWIAGGVRMITLAPELPQGLEAVVRIARGGAIAAIGHTAADAETTARAIDAGARYATHLFNAMPPLAHREPGPVGALLADARVTIGLIADGVHLDPAVLAVAARAATGRLSLVSDGVGERLGAQALERGQAAVRLPDGTLAGSTATLDACVRTMAAIVGAEAAIEAVTSTPARLLGLSDGRGEIRVGGRADLVLLDDALEVRTTIVGGVVVEGGP